MLSDWRVLSDLGHRNREGWRFYYVATTTRDRACLLRNCFAPAKFRVQPGHSCYVIQLHKHLFRPPGSQSYSPPKRFSCSSCPEALSVPSSVREVDVELPRAVLCDSPCVILNATSDMLLLLGTTRTFDV